MSYKRVVRNEVEDGCTGRHRKYLTHLNEPQGIIKKCITYLTEPQGKLKKQEKRCVRIAESVASSAQPCVITKSREFQRTTTSRRTTECSVQKVPTSNKSFNTTTADSRIP